LWEKSGVGVVIGSDKRGQGEPTLCPIESVGPPISRRRSFFRRGQNFLRLLKQIGGLKTLRGALFKAFPTIFFDSGFFLKGKRQ